MVERHVVIGLVEERREEIAALCRQFGVLRLDIFGSALSDAFDPLTSDIDVLVEFRGGEEFDYFNAYFGLREGLEALFGRPVDIVSVNSIRNPYFRDQVMRTRRLLYAA
jgi:predicted nucleotidyltransferase